MPMENTGFRLLIGSCRIIATRLPRIRCISRSLLARRSSPSSRTWPPTVRAAGLGARRRIDRHVMLLPEPDSPTRPSVSPSPSAKETPSTARIVPQRVTRCVRRSRTSRTGVVIARLQMPLQSPACAALSGVARCAASQLAKLGVEGVAEPVAQKIEGEDDEEDGEAGEERGPPGARDEVAGLGDHRAP